MKKNIAVIVGVLVVTGLCIFGYIYSNKDNNDDTITKTDAQKFSEEYTLIGEDNIFVYRNIDEIISVLKNGTGVVFLGFPECSWCQNYVVHLNDVAKELGISKIYYFNILEDRAANTKEYQEIVSIIGDYLQYDDEGKKRIYVPDISVVKDGIMVGHDYETSKDTLGYDDPKDYWTETRIKKLKEKLTTMLSEISDEICTDCN